MLFTLIAFALAIGLLVTIHELGHYWVARRCGVYIERFSIGFGKVLFKRTDKNGCEWALSALPLGGYVMMRSNVPADAPEMLKNTAFEYKTLRQRAAITVAGPLANLLLAVVLYALIGVIGSQEPAAVLGQPTAQSIADYAGLEAGDRVIAVDDTAVLSWPQLRWQLLDRLHTGGEVRLSTQSKYGNQAEHVLQLPATSLDPDGPDPLVATGLTIATPTPFVRETVPNSAAFRAGLLPEDRLLAINGVEIQSAQAFVETIKPLADQTIQLNIERQGQPLVLPVTIDTHLDDQGHAVGRIGIMLGARFEMVNVRYGPIASVQQGLSRTADTFWLSLKMIGRMVTGQVSVKNISGPVSIADYAGQSARIGLTAYIHFLALISISIGLLNLLPIPMLDGGHLLYYAVEAITGRPVSDAVKLIAQRIGLGILAALTMLAFFNDFSRLIN
ncbi:RIP metalloprotease RseP [Paenalcaligenes faecalis]|uniref:RIP metalloprotease RseP n=1 Tax=Paenalcaligenes faecalis TaxID=2980099 RepID=UPI0022B97201|nr:RIP metalloprotease RseP [Paenalcaligenes faecalis]